MQNLGRQINREFEKNWEHVLGTEKYVSLREMLKEIIESIPSDK